MTNSVIRPLQPGDLLTGRGQHKRELFFSPDGLAEQGQSPSWATFLPWGAPGYGLVHESLTQVYASARARRDKWDVVYLAGPAHLSEAALFDAWRLLLERLCQEAGRNGVLRVFVRLPESEHTDTVEVFRRAGFTVYSRERLWRREAGTAVDMQPWDPQAVDLRPQRRSDAWNLHSLYRDMAPPLVQQAEGLTSRDWRPPARRWLGQGARAYVLTLDGTVKAHFCVYQALPEARLRLLAHPEAREVLESLLTTDLVMLDVEPGRSLLALVPEYGGWVEASLDRAGFRPAGVQILLVKHTVAWARVAEPRRRPVMKEVLEPAPTTPAVPAANGERA
ncbi:MAG: hypothetical protein KKA73_10465 [Chloroflexi bacterium]|nr:hypothetical protein [Chloroflexota bacterium]MBU1748100.1 hypothetical protein [Chloroflexota bacterium]